MNRAVKKKGAGGLGLQSLFFNSLKIPCATGVDRYSQGEKGGCRMFKVTFSFENGSVVEAFANAGDNLLELHVAQTLQSTLRVPVMEPAESVGYSLKAEKWTARKPSYQ